MDLFEAMKNACPETEALGEANGTRTKNPRDNVLQLIDNSLAYLSDPNFRVKNSEDKDVVPVLCYKDQGAKVTISLTYAKAKLILNGDKKTYKIDKANLVKAIGVLRQYVNDGYFDSQLTQIQKERSEKQRENAEKKKAQKLTDAATDLKNAA